MEEEAIDDVAEDIDMVDIEQKRRGRPRKSFIESGKDSQKQKTDEIQKHRIKTFALDLKSQDL